MAGRDSGDPVTLHFAGALSLRGVCEPALAACRGLGLEYADEARLAIVVEELLANLFDHGRLAGDGTIELSLWLRPANVEIMLADSGRAFDPREVCAPGNVPARGGGAGLAVVRRWANLRSYEPGPPLNRLRLGVPIRHGTSD